MAWWRTCFEADEARWCAEPPLVWARGPFCDVFAVVTSPKFIEFLTVTPPVHRALQDTFVHGLVTQGILDGELMIGEQHGDDDIEEPFTAEL